MKPVVTVLFVLLMGLAGCGPKPYYQTAEGRKKQKYYNSIQFGGRTTSELKRP